MTVIKHLPRINRTWRKAAVIASLWTVLEILIGTFCKNAGFSNLNPEILCFAGIAVMSAGFNMWKQNGILWRAGLLCALFKGLFITPAAPVDMIAVFIEALIMEACTKMFFPSNLGLALGGGLTMVALLLQKITAISVSYGADVGEIFLKTGKWIDIASLPVYSFNNVLTALSFSVLVFFIAGGLAVVVGQILSRKTELESTFEALKIHKNQEENINIKNSFFSPYFLVLHLVFSVTLILSGNFLNHWVYLALTAVYTGLCTAYYPFFRIVIKKIFFWSCFAVISLIVEIIFKNIPATIYMFSNGVLLAAAFCAISSELYTPAVRRKVEKAAGQDMFEIIICVFGIYPGLIANFPGLKDLLHHPVRMLNAKLSAAPYWLLSTGPKCYLIVGERHSGKSTLLKKIIDGLKASKINPGGFYCETNTDKDGRRCFDLVTIDNNEKKRLCSFNTDFDVFRLGVNQFRADTVETGQNALSEERLKDRKYVCIDEIFSIDLKDNRWGLAIDKLVKSEKRRVIIMTLKPSLIKQAVDYWGLLNVKVIYSHTEYSDELLEEIKEAVF